MLASPILKVLLLCLFLVCAALRMHSASASFKLQSATSRITSFQIRA